MTKLLQGDTSDLLLDWCSVDRAALDKLMPIAYNELRRIARHYMRRGRAGNTLQTSALINEAYIKLVDYDRMRLQDRAHAFSRSQHKPSAVYQ